MTRALKAQKKAALLSLYCFYMISIPMSLVFAFWTKWGVFGLWMGITIGVYAKAFTTGWLVYITDWVSTAKLQPNAQISPKTALSPQRLVDSNEGK